VIAVTLSGSQTLSERAFGLLRWFSTSLIGAKPSLVTSAASLFNSPTADITLDQVRELISQP
jgi:L-lactate permease